LTYFSLSNTIVKPLSQSETLFASTHTLNTPPPTSSPTYSLVQYDAPETDVVKGTNHYPATELEWLATTTFNHAVDYYVQENDALCQEWAQKAMTLAQWAEDGGALRDVLMEKFSGLTWG
jgi:predicted dinucleotide-binding enzyme